MKALSTSWNAKVSSNACPAKIDATCRGKARLAPTTILIVYSTLTPGNPYHITQPYIAASVDPRHREEGISYMRRMSASLVGLLLIVFTQTAAAQTSQLIEAAKKEGGKVIL